MSCDITDAIAKNIKKYRILNHLTQEQMAELLSLDTQYYSQLERNERKFTIEKICAVCELFHLEISKIIEVPAAVTDTSQIESITKSINAKMLSLTTNQLRVLEKYIDEILPLQK